MDAIPDDSPLSTASLEESAERLARAWRVARKRAPKEVNRLVRETLERVFELANGADADHRERLKLARALDRADAKLHDKDIIPLHFYVGNGRLAIVRLYDPITIKGSIRHARLNATFDRYVAPAIRLQKRVNYFLARAGLETKETPEVAPWDQPYAKMQEYHEYLWGKVSGPTKSRMEGG